MPSIDDLTSELTPAECLTALTGILDITGVPTTAWQEGSITRSEIEAFSDMVSYTTWILSGIASSGFLESAYGDWLDIIAQYGGTGLSRTGATIATGSVQVTNNTGGVYSAIAGALVVRNTNTGQEYSNTGAISLLNGANAVYPFQALEAGSDSNAAEGEINKLTTSVSGLTVTNTTTFVAQDQESDDSLKTRIRNLSVANSAYGPSEAYKYWAKQTTRIDGSNVGVTKVKTLANGSGTLTVIVASDVGGIPDDAENLDLVEAQLRTKALTQGPTLVVESAIEQVLTGTIQVYIYNDQNLTADDVQDAVVASLTARIKLLPIGGDNDGDPSDGGKFYRNSFLHAVQSAQPAIYRADSATFTSDLSVAYNAVVVLGAFTITVNFLARPES